MRWNGTGRAHTCYGAGAPVILHYPNASFEYWVKKYRMLTTETNFAEGTQISLKGVSKLSKALDRTLSKKEGGKKEGTEEEEEEVAESTAELLKAQKGDKVSGLHELAAVLVKRAETTGKQSDKDIVSGLYRQMFSSIDMLPPLASYGLLTEITMPREVILKELGEERLRPS